MAGEVSAAYEGGRSGSMTIDEVNESAVKEREPVTRAQGAWKTLSAGFMGGSDRARRVVT